MKNPYISLDTAVRDIAMKRSVDIYEARKQYAAFLRTISDGRLLLMLSSKGLMHVGEMAEQAIATEHQRRCRELFSTPEPEAPNQGN